MNSFKILTLKVNPVALKFPLPIASIFNPVATVPKEKPELLLEMIRPEPAPIVIVSVAPPLRLLPILICFEPEKNAVSAIFKVKPDAWAASNAADKKC